VAHAREQSEKIGREQRADAFEHEEPRKLESPDLINMSRGLAFWR
jgi:hypothetical protein